jgi:hypothetical protein
MRELKTAAYAVADVKGLYAVENEMPCHPNDITIGYYALPATLKRTEREEAAARILWFSQHLDQWVGVSWSRLAEMMKADLLAAQEAARAREANRDEEERVEREMRRYRLLSLVTLMAYQFFVPAPTAKLRDVPEYPRSTIYIMGPGAVVEGVRELVANGMLIHVSERVGDDTLDVFFPTRELVSFIMKKQDVVMA